MINYSVSFPRHPWIFSWMSDTQDCKIPSTWTCITQTLVPFIPPYPSVCIISHRFHISSDMTCLQSKAFAETQCHQLITSFALRKVACTNRICNTSVVQHKNCHVGICTWRESRSLCSCRSSKAVFLALPDWWTLSTKKTPEICWSISSIFFCVHIIYIIFISTHLKTHQTYPAQKLTWQRKISTIWRWV